MEFPCTGCGACCRHDAKAIGRPVDDNGHCIYLDCNKCVIYDERPPECRVKDRFKDAEWAMDEPTFFRFMANHCNQLQIKEKLPEGYRVKLENDK